MNLFQSGKFILNSGRESTLKIECDALTDEDIHTLAGLICDLVRPFSEVEGIPQGGLRLAKVLNDHTTPTVPKRTLLVDDVLTTGGSMERRREQIKHERPWVEIIGAVLFARGPCPAWIQAVFPMPEKLWGV